MTGNIVGQKAQVLIIREYLGSFRGEKPLLLHGPPGTGKTFSVHQLAQEMGMEVFEVNTSDKRNPAELEITLGRASMQRSLFGKDKVLLIDEADNVSERGGMSKIIEIVSSSPHPIVMTANDPWKPRLRALRSKCRMVEFRRLSIPELREILSSFTDNEEAINRAAVDADGDARAAINNLCMPFGAMQRSPKQDVFQVMRNIFRSRGEEALKWINRIDMDLDEFKHWLLENICREIKEGRDIAQAYEAVSIADLFISRAKRTRNYSLMKYARIQLSLGVSSSNRNPAGGFTRYQSPSRIRKMAATKSSRNRIKQKSEEIAENCHLSAKKARTEMLPYMRFISKKFPV